MSLVVPVAHDFNCPWCWIGWFQAKRLMADFGAQIDWRGFELFPDELEWPDPAPRPEPVATNRPATPSRMDLAYAAEGMSPPMSVRPKKMRTHNAHEAVELAKERGCADEVIGRLYSAYWEQGLAINEPEMLVEVCRGVLDEAELKHVLETKKFKDRIIGFDDPAYASGVYNVPTFWIGGERYAEQPYTVLHDAMVAAGAVKQQAAPYG